MTPVPAFKYQVEEAAEADQLCSCACFSAAVSTKVSMSSFLLSAPMSLLLDMFSVNIVSRRWDLKLVDSRLAGELKRKQDATDCADVG